MSKMSRKDYDGVPCTRPYMPSRRKPRLVQPKFWNGTPCIPWCGSIDEYGYGYLNIDGRRTRAHRAIYENRKGKIPHGLVLDHLCCNKTCVNPDHLEAVSNWGNVKRGNSYTAKNSRKTHCPQGHPLSGKNLLVRRRPNRVQRWCRACINAHRRDRRARGEIK